MGEFYVYRHTTPNGKVYVGLTRQKPSARFSNGHGYKFNEHFSRAIEKYGWDNITHEIVYEGLTADEAAAMECQLIAQHNATDPQYGYNNTTGGYVGYRCSAETSIKKSENLKKMWQSDEYRKAFRERMSGDNNPMRKIEITDEFRARMSAINKGRVKGAMKEETKKKLSAIRKAQGNFRTGTHHTEETKRKISESNKGKVVVMTAETRKKLSIALTGITRSAETRAKMSLAQSSRPYRPAPWKWKGVFQIDQNTGEVIKRFNSITEASKLTNSSQTSIGLCCMGKRKVHNGYMWQYATQISEVGKPL